MPLLCAPALALLLLPGAHLADSGFAAPVSSVTPLRESAGRIEASLRRVSTSPQTTTPRRNWFQRHPAITGAIVGFAAGFAIGWAAGDDGVFDDFTGEFNGCVLGGVGAGAGAITRWAIGRD